MLSNARRTTKGNTQFNTSLPFGIFSVVPDVLISASLCYFLKSNKDRKSLDYLITMRYTNILNRNNGHKKVRPGQIKITTLDVLIGGFSTEILIDLLIKYAINRVLLTS